MRLHMCVNHGLVAAGGVALLLGMIVASPAVAAYPDEVLADDPHAYFRLNDDGIDAESLGSHPDALGEVHDDTEVGVPGLINDGDTAMRFLGDTGDDTTGVHLPDYDELNVTNGPWIEKTVEVWFNADNAETDEAQMIFEEGGSTRGINVYVFEGELIMGAWNRAAGDGDGSPWLSGDDDPDGGNIYLNTPINSGENYHAVLVMDGDDSFDGLAGTLTAYVNGQQTAQKEGVGLLYNHGDNAGIGHVHQNTYLQLENWNNGHGLYFEGVIDELALYNTALSADRVMAHFVAGGGVGGATALQAGDANQDFEFNQLDLVQVQIAAKYLSGNPATWGEGDWDGAPGGEQGSPPPGNGLFDQIDIISALGAGTYLTGPYNAIARGGASGDGQTSIIYDPGTGEVSVDAPAGTELTSINIDSAGGIFTGAAAANLGGSFDNDADANIFKATFGGSFGSLSFGNVAQSGLSEDFVAGDLTVVGSLAGGGDLGNVDLIYVPEPSTLGLLTLSALAVLVRRRR